MHEEALNSLHEVDKQTAEKKIAEQAMEDEVLAVAGKVLEKRAEEQRQRDLEEPEFLRQLNEKK